MKTRFVFSSVLPTLLLVAGAWLLFSRSTYPIELEVPGINLAKNDQINWNNFQDFVREIDLDNSTAIFNSILDALRQSASDIHPAGVTYFPAVIPKGTLMYHAGPGKIPDGLEWLAMDAEFSFDFGSRRPSYGRKSLNRRGGPGGPGGPHGKPDGPNKPKNAPPGNRRGSMTMMTFKATRDLDKMLYMDGASASKSTTGEMDTQKMISDLVKDGSDSEEISDNRDHVMAERLYAERICNWGKPFGLDGFIRVEVGFELVLCDFLNGSVELVSNVSFPLVNEALGLPPPTVISSENGWPLDDNGSLIEGDLTEEQLQILNREDKWEDAMRKVDSMVSFDHVRAGQVHDKGDKRIQLDYRHLVTGINRTHLNPDPNNRRLLTETTTLETQMGMLHDLEEGVKQGFDSSESTDWQQVFDEIVDKFTPPLSVMNDILSSEDLSDEQIAANVTRYTTAFVTRFVNKIPLDNSTSFGSGRAFAVYQYTRPLKDLKTKSDYLVWSAAVRVVTEIVDTIFDINEWLWPIVISSVHEDSLKDAGLCVMNSKLRLQELLKSLNWISLNYECESLCDKDEVCYTPSWGPSPIGWALPDSTGKFFGMHYDPDRKRQVIDNQLKCISADFSKQR